MKELTIISGKGGTGKTSVTASFASLAQHKVIVDADVDAADLHLVIPPEIRRQEPFQGGHIAEIDPGRCTQCGECRLRCRFDAISEDFVVDRLACEGCGVCVYFCPVQAIDFSRQVCGQWFVSDTGRGPMVHARLGIAQENSGLLVSVLRKEARAIAEQKGYEWIIVDGPPGIGCPVISSVTGAGGVLVISEPTMSGLHDLKRVNELAAFLRVPAMACVNKYDINPDMSDRIIAYAWDHKMEVAGVIPYDRDMTAAMVARKALVDFSDGPAARAIRSVWENVRDFMKTRGHSKSALKIISS
ncbi:MAG: ATP-binding protein [Thermodesulfobacteriota bacterium]